MKYLKNLGHYSQLGAYRKLPKLKLHSTMNTIVTCSVCRGQGFNSLQPNKITGQVPLVMCPHCKGRKVYHNKVI